MSLKDRPWFPWMSALAWGLVVFGLVLFNSGSVLLALVLAAVVAVISHRIDGRAHRQ